METRFTSEVPSPQGGELLRFVDCMFNDAYTRHLHGESPLSTSLGLAGHLETIALEPPNGDAPDDNARYFVMAGGLDFRGVLLQSGDDQVDLRYIMMKITLAPGDTRRIAELMPEDLQNVEQYVIDQVGMVHTQAGKLEADAAEELLSSMESCRLAPELPSWAYGPLEDA